MTPSLLRLCSKWLRVGLFNSCLLSTAIARADERPSVLGERAENFELAESRTIAPVDVGFGTFKTGSFGEELSSLGLAERNGAALSATVYFPGSAEWLFKAAFADASGSKYIDGDNKIEAHLVTNTLYTGPALNAVMFTSGANFLSGSIGGGALWRDYRATLTDGYVTENDKGANFGGFAEGSLRYHAFTKLVFGLRLWGERCQMNLPQVADQKVIDQTYSTAWEVAFAL